MTYQFSACSRVIQPGQMSSVMNRMKFRERDKICNLSASFDRPKRIMVAPEKHNGLTDSLQLICIDPVLGSCIKQTTPLHETDTGDFEIGQLLKIIITFVQCFR
jgi:hypothetical protein